MPFKRCVAGNTLSIDFIRSRFGTFTFLRAVVPGMRLFASKFACSFSNIPNKRFQTFNTFASQINGESLWADTFLLSLIPHVIGSTFAGGLWGFSFLAFVGFRVEFGTGRAGYAVFFVQVKDRSGFCAVDTFGVRSSEEGGLKGTLGHVVIGDECVEFLIVIINSLVADDPIGGVEVGDVFEIGLGFRDSPGGGSGPGCGLLNNDKKLPYVQHMPHQPIT